MAAFGRKRTLVLPYFGVSERPLWRKADIPEYPQDFHKIDQLGTAAFRPKPDIRLKSVKRSANDPKRTLNPPPDMSMLFRDTLKAQEKRVEERRIFEALEAARLTAMAGLHIGLQQQQVVVGLVVA